MGHVGGIGGEGSGDIFLAFATGLDLAGDGPRYPMNPLMEDLMNSMRRRWVGVARSIEIALVSSGWRDHRDFERFCLAF